METRNQLLVDHHHDQEIHYQLVFNVNSSSSAAAQDKYAPRSWENTSDGLVSPKNLGNYGIAGERTNLEQRLSPELYTGGDHRNALGCSYGPGLHPYPNIYARPDLSNAFEQRPTFNEYYSPGDNESIRQISGGEQRSYHVGYNSPDSVEGPEMPSGHLCGDCPYDDIPQELSSIDGQVLDEEDEGVVEQDEGVNDEDDDVEEDESVEGEDKGDDEDHNYHADEGATNGEGVTNDEVINVEDSIQDEDPALRRKQKAKDFGEVRQETDGTLSYRAKTGDDGSPWERATYLTSEVRRDIISVMSKYGKYKNPRKSGEEEHDQTCFHPDQKDWGKNFDDRPEVLYIFNKPAPPKKRKRPSPIENMVYKGMVVIAYGSNKPIRNFSNIPMVLSTKTEAYLLESWSRENPCIVLQDFCDRMPVLGRPKPRNLSMRRSRFRWKYGLKSWVTRSATKEINAWLDREVPKIYRDANSTRGWDGLTPEQSKALHAISKGLFPERARKAKRAQKKAEGSVSGSSSHAYDQIRTGENQDNSLQSTGSSVDTQTAADPNDKSQQTTKTARARPKKTASSRKTSWDNDSTLTIPDTNSDGLHSDGHLSIGARQDQLHLIDYRDQHPSTEAEKRAIQRALAPTRHQIQDLIGISTQPTDKNASYSEQWIALYQSYRSMAMSGGAGEPQQLGQHDPWLFGIPQQFFIDSCELPETVGPQL